MPFKSPDWLPISIFKIENSDIPKDEVVYENFRTTVDKKLELRFKKNLVKVKKITCNFEKICDNCLNCPRFLLFNLKVKNKKKYYSEDFTLTYEDNKLLGILYNLDVENRDLYVNFIPTYLIKRVFQKEKNFIISLPFDNSKNILKIGKNKIENGLIFNNSLRMNLPVDVNLLIEGEYNLEEEVSYKKESQKINYYQINKIEDIYLIKDFLDDKLTLGCIRYSKELNK